MRVPQTLVDVSAGGVIIPAAMSFFQSTIVSMIPWLITMFIVIIADLIAGLRKALKLGIHVSISLAFRETMGKMVTYFAFVAMVCMIQIASDTDFQIAKYGCWFICVIEGTSIVGNILKPCGLDISLKTVFKVLAKKFSLTDDEADELITDDQKTESTLDTIVNREKDRWEKRKK
jgi:hypothetical protein